MTNDGDSIQGVRGGCGECAMGAYLCLERLGIIFGGVGHLLEP